MSTDNHRTTTATGPAGLPACLPAIVITGFIWYPNGCVNVLQMDILSVYTAVQAHNALLYLGIRSRKFASTTTRSRII